MAKFIYVDNSNVFIEGQRVSAVHNGSALDITDAIMNRNLDFSYRLDFGKLYTFLVTNGSTEVARAMLFGSRPPPNDTLWAIAKSAGFEPIIEDRNAANKEKKIDTGIVAAMFEHAFTEADKSRDTFVLVAGDGDYMPAVDRLVKKDFRVDVAFWDHASRELRAHCSNFISMNPFIETLSH